MTKWVYASILLVALGLVGCGASQDELAKTSAALEAAQKEITALKSKINSQEAEIAGLTQGQGQKLSQLKTEYANLQKMFNEKSSALDSLQSQLDKFKSGALGDSSELNRLKSLLTQKDAQLSTKDSQLKQKDDQIGKLMEQIEAFKKGGLPSLGGIENPLKN